MKNFSQRVAAVDVFRALTMFLMLFVNDIPGLKNIPHWLGHATIEEDMLGFSDTIFPAFLFCMGMAIPFAIQNRFHKGDKPVQAFLHILQRSFALLVMGVFTVNTGGVEGLSQPWIFILMVLGFFLVWGVYPKSNPKTKRLFWAMKTLGICLLTYIIVYKGAHGAPFTPQWWGILGLIGWTYLICSTFYLFTRESLWKNSLLWSLFIVLALLHHSSVVSLTFIPSEMTLHCFGMSGILTALLMQQYARIDSHRIFFLSLIGLGILMLAGGLLSHPHWIISKLQGTPTWFFFCMALFFPLFGLFYWLTDLQGKAHWFSWIKPAGTATLTCYVLPYIWYGVQQLIGFHYPTLLGSGIPGLLKSVVFSFLIVALAGGLVRAKIKLKL